MTVNSILVTGATGNVGQAVTVRLVEGGHSVFAGVRDPQRARASLAEPVRLCHLDFEAGVYPEADFDSVFLVRPPHLAASQPFASFVQSLPRDCRIVFLSVFGADRKRFIPHAKIEQVIRDSGNPHVFLRPTYFMENLLTTLRQELEENRRIFLPAGNLAFNWIAVSDIAEAAALALTAVAPPTAIEISSRENWNFNQVVKQINRSCGTDLQYESPSLPAYVLNSLRSGATLPFVAVMLLLHYLPRYSRKPDYHPDVFEAFARRSATTFEEFVEANRDRFGQLT